MTHEPHAFTVPQRVFVWLAAANLTALLLANVVGVKLFRFEVPAFGRIIPVEHTAGMLAFPVTFLLTDLINEYFGRKAARRAAYVAFAMAGLAWTLLWVARKVPVLEGIPGTATQASFDNVFGAAALMYIASIVAFLFGNLLDIYLFGVFKRLTGGRLVWLRASGSTVVSQFFDSIIVTFVFFQLLQRWMGQETPSLEWTAQTAATGYVLKFVIAVALTPLIYAGRWTIRNVFGLTPLPPE
ncbi:MAG: queuosine precursor transporter [Planctomycetota bacterium]|nr:queuosine precursor transporter [Planctomycetota bacterium]